MKTEQHTCPHEMTTKSMVPEYHQGRVLYECQSCGSFVTIEQIQSAEKRLC